MRHIGTQSGMWLFERCYLQQPNVLFKHQLIMTARGSTDGSQLVWSTSQQFNHLLQKQLRVPTLRVRACPAFLRRGIPL